MDITTLLAQLWGPTLLAIGIGIFTVPNYYLKVYRDLQKETLAVLLFGIVAIVAGIAQIIFHNTWNTFPEIVITLLGWGTLLKGFMFAIAPEAVDRAGDWQADTKLIPYGGLIMLVLGVYLSWVGFLM